MTAGSIYRAVGEALIEMADPLLPGWHVRYDEPTFSEHLQDEIGEYRAMWVDIDGTSTYTPVTLGVGLGGRQGYQETANITFVLQRIVGDEMGPTQADIDAEVDQAAGVLFDMITSNPKPAAALPPGWQTIEVRVVSSSRSGGRTANGKGLGRRLELTVAAIAVRC